MSALPVDYHEEPRLARLLTKVSGWQAMYGDVVRLVGRQGEKALVQSLRPPYRTALVNGQGVSFECECDNHGLATHLVQASVVGTQVLYLVCDECCASEQYIRHQIEWNQISEYHQEEPVIALPLPATEPEEPSEPAQKRVRPHAATGSALVEQAESLWAAMQEHGWSASEAGRQFGITQIKASEFARLARAPEELREAVRRGEMSLYGALAEAKARLERRPARPRKPQPEPTQAQEEQQGEEPEQMIRAALQEIARDWTKEERERLEARVRELEAEVETWQASSRDSDRIIENWAEMYGELRARLRAWSTSARSWRTKAKASRKEAERRQDNATAWCDKALQLEREANELRAYLQEALASRQSQTININGGTVTIITKGE